MHNHQYNEVLTNDDNFKWKPFLRQMFVCSAAWASNFMLGLTSGTPTVLIPQLRQEANSTEVVSEEIESWISSAVSLSAIVWLILLPFFASKFGRRISMIIVGISSTIGFIVFSSCNTVSQILISEMMHGAAESAMIIVSPIIIAEYSSPYNRGLLLTIKSASFTWGIWIANAIGSFFHWKIIGYLGLLCSVYVLTAFFWPESPHWLAARGRFEECSKAYRWLNGTSAQTNVELRALISFHTQKFDNSAKYTRSYLKNILSSFKTKQFYKPFFLVILIGVTVVFSGKSTSTMYALTIVKKMTNNTRAATSGMLILDGLSVISAYASCGLIKVSNARLVFLISVLVGTLFTLAISLHVYLINLDVFDENLILSISLLSGYNLSICCGPMTVAGSLMIEIMPFEFISLMLFLNAITSQIIIIIFLKMSPMIFRVIGVHGMFLLYALPTLFSLGLLYKHLPQTKEKMQFESEKSSDNCIKSSSTGL